MFWKAITWVICAVAIYAIVLSSIPYLFQRKLSHAEKSILHSVAFTNNTTGPDRAALIEEPHDAFNARIALLRTAQKSISFSCHTLDKSDTAFAFLAELYKAAERGVKIRIIFDAKTGGFFYLGKEYALLSSHPNITLFSFNPISILKPWRLHSLLHDKFILIDNDYLLLGGRNIVEKQYAPAGYMGEVTLDRDVFVWNTQPNSPQSVLLQAKNYMTQLCEFRHTKKIVYSQNKSKAPVKQLMDIALSFEAHNSAMYTQNIFHYQGRTVETNCINLIHNPISSSPKAPWLGYQMNRIAQLAKKEVVMQSPYATGNKHMLRAFQFISSKTPLYFITNSLASTPNLPAFSNYIAQRKKFIKTGANIYEYQSEHSIHAKSMLVDDKISVVGSFNLDDRSLYIDTETMLVIDSPLFAVQLRNAMESTWHKCLQVSRQNNYAPSAKTPPLPVSFIKKLLMWVFSLFSRLFQPLI